MARPVEEIPDEDRLFRRIHESQLKRGTISRRMGFKYDADGISVDWEKYITPEEVRTRCARKPAREYRVVSLVAGKVREINNSEVRHAPISTNECVNRAHALITTEDESDRLELQTQLVRSCVWLEST